MLDITVLNPEAMSMALTMWAFYMVYCGLTVSALIPWWDWFTDSQARSYWGRQAARTAPVQVTTEMLEEQERVWRTPDMERAFSERQWEDSTTLWEEVLADPYKDVTIARVIAARQVITGYNAPIMSVVVLPATGEDVPEPVAYQRKKALALVRS